MIKTTKETFERIIEAKCDCCGDDIKLNHGRLPDHMKISGYCESKILEAIVCIKCMEGKLNFINIQRKTNTIGYC